MTSVLGALGTWTALMSPDCLWMTPEEPEWPPSSGTLRAHPGGPSTLSTALSALRTAEGAAPAPSWAQNVLTMDASPAALEALPDPLDLSPFEEHLPCAPARRIHGLRRTWLPLRVHVLRLLSHTLSGADGAGGATAAASAPPLPAHAAAQEAVDQMAALVASVGSEATTYEAAEGIEEVPEDWTAILAVGRLTVALLAAPPDGAVDAVLLTTTLAATKLVLTTTLAQCAAPLASLRAAEGYPPSVLSTVAHLLHLTLPLLSVSAMCWAALLPGGKKKKKGAVAAAAEADDGAPDAALPASSAQPADARAAVRETLGAIAEAVSTLQVSLSAADRRPAACVLLGSEPDEWVRCVGGAAGERAKAVASTARQALLAALEAEGKARLAELATSAREVAGALKVAAKAL